MAKIEIISTRQSVVFAVAFVLFQVLLIDMVGHVEAANQDESSVVSYEIEKHRCTFFYKERYPTFVGGLINCTWYTSKACCKRTEVTSVFSAMEPLYGASVLCRNYINYLMCYFCSPEQYKFYRSNKKLMVCPKYCNALYEECKSAGFNKTLISEVYGNGTAFCEAQNFEVVDFADCFDFDPFVFGSSPTFGVSVYVMLLMVVRFAVFN